MPISKFTEPAYAQLDDMFSYTLETWGINQAYEYYDGLVKQANKLAENPQLGKFYEPYKTLGVRVFAYEKHLLYYTEQPHGITVICVTHQSMDQLRHFSDTGNA